MQKMTIITCLTSCLFSDHMHTQLFFFVVDMAPLSTQLALLYKYILSILAECLQIALLTISEWDKGTFRFQKFLVRNKTPSLHTKSNFRYFSFSLLWYNILSLTLVNSSWLDFDGVPCNERLWLSSNVFALQDMSLRSSWRKWSSTEFTFHVVTNFCTTKNNTRCYKDETQHFVIFQYLDI